MLPFAPDWRWTLTGERSPWYPQMRLFRQAKPGDWSGVIVRPARRAAARRRGLISRDQAAARMRRPEPALQDAP